MTTTTSHPLPTGQLRRAAALVKAPRVMIAAVLWLLLIESMPDFWGWGILAVVVCGTVAGVVAESMVVRLLWRARRPSVPLAIAGEPHVRVLVTRRQVDGVAHAGRRHLVVPLAWIRRTDLPVLLAWARRRQLMSAGRFEVAYLWFTWPWQVLGSFVGGIAHGVSKLPLIGFAWRVRVVVAGIAIWQSVAVGRISATIGIVVVIGLTYLLPWTTSHHEHLVRQALADLDPSWPAPATLVTPRPAADPIRPAAAGHSPCTRRRTPGTTPSCGQLHPSPHLATCTAEGIRGQHISRTDRRKGSPS
nr:hypothetical protein [Propionibacterium sp.]